MAAADDDAGSFERLDLMGWVAPSRHLRAKVAVEVTQKEPSAMELATIGLDLAKQVFQVHGVDEVGHVVVKRRLRRAQVVTYFASLPPAWSAWRPAPPRTSGRASCWVRTGHGQVWWMGQAAAWSSVS
jgi:hypothetical protein